MARKGWTVAFDADDTLWHNERGFALSQDRFRALLAEFTEADHLSERLIAAERRNLQIYGFGVKGFVLSMIETAVEVTEAQVSGEVVAELLALGRTMLEEPPEVFEGVRPTIEAVSESAEILLITKGDLLDQERKLAQSGLGDLFDRVEIVSDKTPDTYARIFAGHDTAHHMMVGNSLRSDVIPALAAGAWAVHVPHELTWVYEEADPPVADPRFRRLENLGDLPALIATLD